MPAILADKEVVLRRLTLVLAVPPAVAPDTPNRAIQKQIISPWMKSVGTFPPPPHGTRIYPYVGDTKGAGNNSDRTGQGQHNATPTNRLEARAKEGAREAPASTLRPASQPLIDVTFHAAQRTLRHARSWPQRSVTAIRLLRPRKGTNDLPHAPLSRKKKHSSCSQRVVGCSSPGDKGGGGVGKARGTSTAQA